MSGITFDWGDFESEFQKLVEKSTPEDLARGLFRAGNELLRDAIYEKPFAPFDLGHLRGSARTQGAGSTMYEMTPDAPPDFRPMGENTGELGINSGFRIVYAARWHELTPEQDRRISWTLPGSGRKYLESKMSRYREKYREIMALYLKRRLGG